ncbi:MAG TPA: carboxypeptidase regulatory-like domain-containing protein, partial [Myxococcales bacterium]|nr:carboxypeptidase regulatory-like domain-containing protein [Myxococcales bacterium]
MKRQFRSATLRALMRFALTALLLLITGPIAALPVRVMSRSTMDMQLNRTWNQLQVRGQLRDDNTEAVPGAQINLSIPKWGQLNTQTDQRGRFEFSLNEQQFDELMKVREHHRGVRVPLQLSFAGDHRLGPSSAKQMLDLSKEFLQLHAAISPPRSNVSSPPRILAVLRHGADPVPGQSVSIRVAGSTMKDTTDRNGRVVFQSPSDQSPGVYQAHIKFDGSARYNAAESTRQYTIERHTVILLSVAKTHPDQLSIQVQGQLKGDALPLAGPVAITIHNNEYLLLEADKQGHFEGLVDLTKAAVRWGPRQVEL